MPKKTVLYLALTSLAVAAVLTACVYRLVEKSKPVKAHTPVEAAAEIIVASARLPLGTRLEPEHLKRLPWPKKALPVGYSDRLADVTGRVLLSDLAENEPVLPSKLAPEEAAAGLAGIIEPGHRAVAVKVNDVISVAGFTTPGARVDVLMTAARRETREPMTRTVLQDIPVLAADQHMEKDTEGKPVKMAVVTLSVMPSEGEALALAANEGKIQLALRNPLDRAQPPASGVRLASLLGGVPAPRRLLKTKPAPVRPAIVVEVWSGAKRSEQRF